MKIIRPIVFSLVIGALLAASCALDLPGSADNSGGSATQTANSGTITVAVPTISSALAAALQGTSGAGVTKSVSATAASTSLSLSTSSIAQAMGIADSVNFTLKDSLGAVVDSWSYSPKQPPISQSRSIPAGIGYILAVEIFNTDVSLSNPVVSGTSQPFDVTAGADTSVSVTCIPTSPQVAAESTVYSASLVPTHIDPTNPNPYDWGGESWFQVTPQSDYTEFIATPDSQHYAYLLVFDNSGSQLTSAGSNISGQAASVTLATTSGTTYYVVLATTDYDPTVTSSYFNFEYQQASGLPFTTFDSWTAFTTTTAGSTFWYYFDAVSGQQYQIAWDDAVDGSAVYTADVQVSAYHPDKTTAYFSATDSGYTTPQTFTATESGRVYVKLDFTTAGSSALKVSMPPVVISAGQFGSWLSEEIAPYNIRWFQFDATSGQQYTIAWDNFTDGSGTYTANLEVSAYYGDKSATYFYGGNSGYTIPQTFTAAETGPLYIMVEEFSRGYSSGTFGLKVTSP